MKFETWDDTCKRIARAYHRRGIELTPLQVGRKIVQVAEGEHVVHSEAILIVEQDAVGHGYRKEQ